MDTPSPWRPLDDGPDDATTMTLGGARIDRVSVSEMDNNVYVLTCTASGERLLVDAADDPDRIMALLQAGGRGDRLPQVLTTHRHWDHHRALPQVVARTGARTLAGADDADELPVPTEVRLGHGDSVEVGDLTLTAIALRGHTPGSVALALEQAGQPAVLITGDSLFPGGPGKTGSPEDFTSLMDDLEARVFDAYPDDTLVLPGHGDSTVIGEERSQIPQWRARGW